MKKWCPSMYRLLCLLMSIGCGISLCGIPHAHAAFTETFGTSTGKDATMNEFYRAEGNVGVISRGTGLSNPRSGTITINTIPAGVTIKQAWLYWGGYLTNVTETQLGSVNFNGTAITPTSSPGAVEFGRESNRRAFRADVSTLINAGGNGSYPVSVTSHTRKSTFGATLIIVYEDPNSLDGTLVIVDGMVMISLSHANNVDNGTSFASTINNLTLSDPPNGQATIIVSEGTAVDENEFTFNGSTSHNFGDFASNNDGLVWDNRTVDVADYLSAATTSVSSTLADVDNPGWYSHYYLFMFYTNRMLANFSESTVTIGNGSDVRAGETVEAEATLENTGAQQGDATLTLVFDNDTNVDYVPESTVIDGTAKTDASDGDGVTYDNGTSTLTITAEDVAVDDTVDINFDVTADSGLSTGDNISVQGEITTNGATVQTDSDGDKDDGIDNPAQNNVVNGYRIKNLRQGLKARLKSGSTELSTDPTSEYLTTQSTVAIKTQGTNQPVADIVVPFTQDENAVNVDVQTSPYATLVHNIGDITAQSFTMYVSIPTFQQTFPVEELSLRLCEGATNLEEVHAGCGSNENVTSELLFSDGDTINGKTCSIQYENSLPRRWVCTGLVGTGGQSEGPEGLVPEFHWFALLALGGGCYYYFRRSELWIPGFANVRFDDRDRF